MAFIADRVMPAFDQIKVILGIMSTWAALTLDLQADWQDMVPPHIIQWFILLVVKYIAKMFHAEKTDTMTLI